MKSNDQFQLRQLFSLCTMVLLVPVLRLFPVAPAALAGRAAWLSALAAAPVLLLYLLFLCRFLAFRREGEGLAELTLRCLGDKLGRAALLLFAAWLLLYAGFALRSGADRYVITVFPHSENAVFIVTLGLLALIGALGPARSLARSARMALPILLLLLLTILLFALPSVRRVNLLPLTVYDSGALLKGALPVVNVLSLGLYAVAFLLGSVPKEQAPFRGAALWLVRFTLFLTLMSAAVIGCFSAELCARLTQPFFSLVRNLIFFRSLERAEAFVVTLWVFPDFLLAALLLFSAQHCLRLSLGMDPRYTGQRRWDLRSGRWIIPLCGLTCIALGLLLAPDAASMRLWSERLIPLINLAFAFGLLPLTYIVGKQKKTL